MSASDLKTTLLICTLGGSIEPIVVALKRWRPVRVRLVHTPQTREDIDKKLVPLARAEGVDLDAGRYDLTELPDGQDLASCIDKLRYLTPMVDEWVGRGAAYQVVVDFTGGTKCMSAAIAIQASRWPVVFSYVGGLERTKDGVGVVVSGSERVIYQANPWDALGHQAVAEFSVLFDQSAFSAAADVATRVLKHQSRHDRRRELAALEQLARALDAWDRFDHDASRKQLDLVAKAANDIRSVLGPTRGERVLQGVSALIPHLSSIVQEPAPSQLHVLDLLANAQRRIQEGRLDDAVARLYRAIEAHAQVVLKTRHRIESTERIPLEAIPEPLRTALSRRSTDGIVALGLQDAYALLLALGDTAGDLFQSAGLHMPTSPLVVRNRSILAHGFARVPASVVDKLWSATLSLLCISADQLPAFPKLMD